MVWLEKSSSVVSTPQSSAFTQPKVLTSSVAGETGQPYSAWPLSGKTKSSILVHIGRQKIESLPTHLLSLGPCSSAPRGCSWFQWCSRRPKSPGHSGNTSEGRLLQAPPTQRAALSPHLHLSTGNTTEHVMPHSFTGVRLAKETKSENWIFIYQERWQKVKEKKAQSQ